MSNIRFRARRLLFRHCLVLSGSRPALDAEVLRLSVDADRVKLEARTRPLGRRPGRWWAATVSRVPWFQRSARG